MTGNRSVESLLDTNRRGVAFDIAQPGLPGIPSRRLRIEVEVEATGTRAHRQKLRPPAQLRRSRRTGHSRRFSSGFFLYGHDMPVSNYARATARLRLRPIPCCTRIAWTKR